MEGRIGFIETMIEKAKSIGIAKKMIIGYFFVIVMPILLFGWILYSQFYQSVTDDYVESRQQLLEQAHTNFQVNLAQAESTYELVQFNTNIVEYLSGIYRTESEQVYAYLKYINPLLAYMKLGNPYIEHINLYILQSGVMATHNILRIEALPDRSVEALLSAGKGVWKLEKDPAGSMPNMIYYQAIYNKGYSKRLGILEVSLKKDSLQQFFDALGVNEGAEFVLTGNRSEMIYHTSLTGLTDDELADVMERAASGNSRYFNLAQPNVIVNSIRIEGLGVQLYWLAKDPKFFSGLSQKQYTLIALIVVLLVILSWIYYMVASSLTKRVLHLARHMRKVDSDNLTLYTGRQDRDEIGMLAGSFNALLERINELVNNVHRAELHRKEAAYLVLQAQIKPHFLYNTLESIRMMAEIKGDTDISEICYAFGKFMRYSLSSHNMETSLGEELENIEHFIKIHKLRLGDRFAVDVETDPGIESFRCPRFILQPIVENAVVHGISKIRGQGLLTIRIRDRGEAVEVAVSDNGRGVPEARLATIHAMLQNKTDIRDFQSESGGHGLYNINQRIKTYYGGDSELQIYNETGGGTTCLLKLAKGDASICSA